MSDSETTKKVRMPHLSKRCGGFQTVEDTEVEFLQEWIYTVNMIEGEKDYDSHVWDTLVNRAKSEYEKSGYGFLNQVPEAQVDQERFARERHAGQVVDGAEQDRVLHVPISLGEITMTTETGVEVDSG